MVTVIAPAGVTVDVGSWDDHSKALGASMTVHLGARVTLPLPATGLEHPSWQPALFRTHVGFF